MAGWPAWFARYSAPFDLLAIQGAPRGSTGTRVERPWRAIVLRGLQPVTNAVVLVKALIRGP
jgi:hypothetical protein